MMYCRAVRCTDKAEPVNYVLDTPLCARHERVVRLFVERGTRVPWRRVRVSA
jgi:hypothetical protein